MQMNYPAERVYLHTPRNSTSRLWLPRTSGNSMQQVPWVWPIAGRTPGEPVGLVMGRPLRQAPAGKHPQRKWIVPKERQLVPHTPVITPARIVPRLSFTWCNHSLKAQAIGLNLTATSTVVPNFSLWWLLVV